MALIEAQQLQLNDHQSIDLSIEKGELTVILGAAGSGKSALLKCLAGVDAPHSGNVNVLGYNPQQLDAEDWKQLRRNAAYVMPNSALVSNHTVLQNVCLPLIYHRICRRKHSEECAIRTLEQLGFDGDVLSLPSALTEQQKRLVNVARNLVLEPRVMLVDEAFAYLDALGRAHFVALYQQLQQQGLSLVLATHHANAAKACGEQFIFMTGKHILSFNSWDELEQSEDRNLQHYLAQQ